MPAIELPPLLARHAQVLWRSVQDLCSAGFAVDPYEAHVLMADFAAEVWQRSGSPPLATAAARLGAAEHQLAAQFFEFSANCWPALHAAGWRLRDLYSTFPEPLAPGAGPAGADGDINTLVDALRGLNDDDYRCVTAFGNRGLRGEWLLAEKQGTSIRTARHAMGEAVERWLRLAHGAKPADVEIAVGQQLWGEGWHVASVGRKLGVPEDSVAAARRRIGLRLAAALRVATEMARTRRTCVSENKFGQYIELLATRQHEAAEQLMRRERPLFLEQLDATGLPLDPRSASVAAENPQLLAKAYEKLLGPEVWADRMSPRAERAIRWQLGVSEQVGQALAALLESLPPRLADWRQLLPRSAAGRFNIVDPAAYPSIRAAGPKAAALGEYGLLPEAIVGIARSLHQQFDEIRAQEATPSFFAQPGKQLDVAAPSPVAEMTGDMLQACVQAAPHVPDHDGLVAALARWTVDVIGERPYFVPGFQLDLASTGNTGAVRITATALDDAQADADLRALWVRPRPNSRQAWKMR